MKTINSPSEEIKARAPYIGNTFPCWYVDFEKNNENKKESKWKFGIKFDNKGEEHSFELASIKNYKNDDWEKVISIDFATTLLSIYKKGGKKAVKEWVSNGCA